MSLASMARHMDPSDNPPQPPAGIARRAKTLTQNVSRIPSRFDEFSVRLEEFHGHLSGRFDELAGRLSVRFDEFSGRLEEFHGRLSGRFDEYSTRMGDLATQLVDRMGWLASRFDALERALSQLQQDLTYVPQLASELDRIRPELAEIRAQLAARLDAEAEETELVGRLLQGHEARLEALEAGGDATDGGTPTP